MRSLTLNYYFDILRHDAVEVQLANGTAGAVMKKLWILLTLSIMLVQSFLLPAVVHADGCPLTFILVDTTLPVTDIGLISCVSMGELV